MLLGCVLIAGNAQASSVFMGSVAGYFSNADAGRGDYTKIKNNDIGYSASDSSVFNWGLTSSRYRDGNKHYRNRYRNGDERYRRADKKHGRGRMPSTSSSFAFDGVGSDYGETGFSASTGQAFSLGSFSYMNEATYFSRGVRGVDFSLAVEIDGDAIEMREFTYMLEILNTPNKSSNPADFVSLLNNVNSQSILHDNVLYELEILGFSRDGGNTFENSTWADEGSGTSAEIYARFNTVSAVPVPAAVWLFGSGLLGLVAFARKHS